MSVKLSFKYYVTQKIVTTYTIEVEYSDINKALQHYNETQTCFFNTNTQLPSPSDLLIGPQELTHHICTKILTPLKSWSSSLHKCAIVVPGVGIFHNIRVKSDILFFQLEKEKEKHLGDIIVYCSKTHALEEFTSIEP